MRKAAFLLVIILVSLHTLAQNPADTSGFIPVSDGSQYKIKLAPAGKPLTKGCFMEMDVVAKCRDSVLLSTIDDAMPQYSMYDTAAFPVPFKEIFVNVHTGDSVMVRIPTDSLISKSMGQVPAFIKPHDWIYQTYVIKNKYDSKAQVDSAMNTHMAAATARSKEKQQEMIQKILVTNKAQIEIDNQLINKYLASKSLKSVKAPWGTFVVMKKEGKGRKATEDDVVSVNYTGSSFGDGKVFDSNTDPKFNHVEPYDVDLSHVGSVILGWTDALLTLKEGSQATIFIPSTLGYGEEGNPSGGIAPNTILIFDIEIKKVKSKNAPAAAPAKPAAPAKAPAKAATGKPAPAKAKTTPTVKPKPTVKKAGQ